MKLNPIADSISRTFGSSISQALDLDRRFGGSGLMNRRAVPMTKILEAGVDLTKFESDYHYNAHFDIVFVTRGSRLDVWLYLAV